MRDLPEWRIAEIAGTKLRAPYHQEADIDRLDPRIAYAEGISRRLLVNLAVNRFDGGAYNVTFLLDTGSPITSLSPEVGAHGYVIMELKLTVLVVERSWLAHRPQMPCECG